MNFFLNGSTKTSSKASLKTNIKRKLKTFSELTKLYNTDSIYRTGAVPYYSKTAKHFNLEGVPTNRITLRPLEEEDETRKTEDILEPVWYSSSLESAIQYCYKDKIEYEKRKARNDEYGIHTSPPPPDCETYQYIPYDESKTKRKRLLFLDLNGEKVEYLNRSGKNVIRYYLDIPLVTQLYKVILKRYEHRIFDVDGEKTLCVDNPCNNPFSVPEIQSAYGGFRGIRSSEHYIDRFFTLELFHTIKELNIESELNCVIMGYFHGDVMSGEFDNDKKDVEEDGYLPAEFAIPYKCTINKNYMRFVGRVASGDSIHTASGIRQRNKSRKKLRNNSKRNMKRATTRRQIQSYLQKNRNKYN